MISKFPTIRLQGKLFDGVINEQYPLKISSTNRFIVFNLYEKLTLFEYDINLTISSIECNRYDKFVQNLSMKQSTIVAEKFYKRSVGEFDPHYLTPELEFRIHTIERSSRFMKFDFLPICNSKNELLGTITDDYEFVIYQQMEGKAQKWQIVLNITKQLYELFLPNWKSPIRKFEEYSSRKAQFEITEFSWNPILKNNKLELVFSTRDGIIHFANLNFSEDNKLSDLTLLDKKIVSNMNFIETLIMLGNYLIWQSSEGEIVIFDFITDKKHFIWSQKDNYPSYGFAVREYDSYIDLFFIKPGCVYRASFMKKSEKIYLNIFYENSKRVSFKNLFHQDDKIFITFPDSCDYVQINITNLPEPESVCDISKNYILSQILDSDETERLTLYGITQSAKGLVKVAIFARNQFCHLTDKPNNIRILFFTNTDICDIFEVISNNIKNEQCEYINVQLHMYRQAIYQAFNSERFFNSMKNLFDIFINKFKNMKLNNLLDINNVMFLKFCRNVGLRLKEYCDIFNMPQECFNQNNLNSILEILDVAILKSIFDSWLKNSGIHLKNNVLFIGNEVMSLEKIVSLYNIDCLKSFHLKNLDKNILDAIVKVMQSKIDEASLQYQSFFYHNENQNESHNDLLVCDYFNRCPLCDLSISKVEHECFCSAEIEEEKHRINPCCNSLILPKLNVELMRCFRCKMNCMISESIWNISAFKDQCYHCI